MKYITKSFVYYQQGSKSLLMETLIPFVCVHYVYSDIAFKVRWE